LPQSTLANEADNISSEAAEKTLAERLSLNFKVLTSLTIQEPADSTQNPGNNFLQMPGYNADLELRPNVRLDVDPLDLSIKPRMRLETSVWREGARKGDTDWNDDWFFNEWLARWKARENIFLSYGRENLQWGPAYLFSPSNPFFKDNGRSNPKREVPGMDFGRLVWIPTSVWSVSLIANSDEGRSETVSSDDFEKRYALKVDYAGRDNYGSMIVSHSEDSENSFGVFGGWTLSDAVLLYGEGAVEKGCRALYPRIDNSIFGASMQKVFQDDPAYKTTFLAGGSYTFEWSGTLTMEYLFYGHGYSDKDADIYYSLRRKAANAMNQEGWISALAKKTLGETACNGLRFLRQNYTMLQYTQNDIKDTLDLIMRLTMNWDDGSYQVTTILEHSFGNHFDLFLIASRNAGNGDTEFGSIYDYQCMIGLEYTF